MKNKALFLIIVLLVITPFLFAGKKDPARRAASDARAAYANELDKAMELMGYAPLTFTFGSYSSREPRVRTYNSPACVVCRAGDRTVLVIFDVGGPDDVERVLESVILPRAQEIQDLGFEYVELRSLVKSANYPTGIADFSVEKLAAFLRNGRNQNDPQREEAAANSWHTQAFCEKNGYVWTDGACHAKGYQ